MQGAYLAITLGFQFFLIVGYLFYAIFRAYPTGDDRISLMSWITGLIGVLTFGLVGVLLLTITRMPASEAILALAFSLADIIGLYLLVDDTRSQENQVLTTIDGDCSSFFFLGYTISIYNSMLETISCKKVSPSHGKSYEE